MTKKEAGDIEFRIPSVNRIGVHVSRKVKHGAGEETLIGASWDGTPDPGESVTEQTSFLMMKLHGEVEDMAKYVESLTREETNKLLGRK